KGSIQQNGLGRVTHRAAAGLAVEQQLDRLVQVRGGVDVEVALARARLDRGNGRVQNNRLDQSRPTARDDDVDQAAGSDQVLDGVVTIARQQLDDVAAKAPLGGDVLQQLHQLLVGLAGGTGAAQQRDVAGLDGQAEGVDGDVRAGL